MPRKTRPLSLNTTSRKSSRRGGSVPSLMMIIAMIIVGLIIAGAILIFGKKVGLFDTRRASITGTVVYTALKPDPGDRGTVRLFYKEQGGRGDFQDAGIDIPLVPNQTWEWAGAEEGKIYQLQGAVVIDGNVVKRSDTETVTAPASDVDLAIKVNWRDLPSDVVANSNLSIGGTVNINGYIPARSQLQIMAVENTPQDGEALNIGDQLQDNEKVVQSISNPTNANVWSWSAAQPLQEYVFRAVLNDSSGNQIGESEQIVNVEAADQQVTMIINSQAQPPAVPTVQASPTPGVFSQLAQSPSPQAAAPSPVASSQPSAQPSPSPAPPPTAKISGTVVLNGPMNQGTSLLMLWRQPGQQNFNVINRYNNPVNSGTSWEFDNAVPGQQYQIQAALQVNGNNTSTAPQPVTVTAPAANVNFTLNTNFLVPAPGTQPVFQTCINNNQAVIVLPAVSNAARYWVQVGNNNQGDSSYANTQIAVSPNSGEQKITVGVNRGQQSFVRYSYAECSNCTDPNNFSPWSTTVGFTCE